LRGHGEVSKVKVEASSIVRRTDGRKGMYCRSVALREGEKYE
jgi:hypothetical protein